MRHAQKTFIVPGPGDVMCMDPSCVHAQLILFKDATGSLIRITGQLHLLVDSFMTTSGALIKNKSVIVHVTLS